MEQFSKNNNSLEKQQAWNTALADLERVVDGLGLQIEESIKETVVAFNINGIPTDSSCGGHIEPERLSFPYVMGQALGEPEFRYEGEEAIVHDIAEKYNLKRWRDLFGDSSAEKEYDARTAELLETKEYSEWYAKNTPLTESVQKLVTEFNATRTRTLLHLSPIYPGFRVEANDKKKIPSDPEETKAEIRLAQEEFRAFTEFLKERYFASRTNKT